ncbi:MAG: T9SS type A sorting domain-containing protein [bacterium]
MKALMLLTLLFPISALASWPQTYEGGFPGGVAIDSYDNVIVTGGGSADSLATAHTIKYDSSGGIIWSQDFEVNTIYGGDAGVVCDKHNNIIVGGCVYNGEGYAYCTLKYSAQGTLLWSRILNNSVSPYSDMETDVAVDNDNNIVVTGMGHPNYCTVKYDSMGTELWRKNFYNGGTRYSNPHLTTDIHNNVIVSLRIGDNNESYVVKYSPAGDSLWAIQFDDTIINAGPITMGKDNNIILASTLYETDTSCIICISKFDSMGTNISRKKYAYNQAIFSRDIAIDNTGNIITAGFVEIKIDSNYSWSVTKYTPNGDSILWNRIYNKENIGFGCGVAVNSKNEIFVTGASVLNDTIPIWRTLKYDSNGNLIAVEESSSPQSNPKSALQNPQLNVSQNPFSKSTIITYSVPRLPAVGGNNYYTNTLLTIYDIAGKLVKSFPITQSPNSPITSVPWDGTDNNGRLTKTGIYFVRLTAGDFSTTKKLILIR